MENPQSWGPVEHTIHDAWVEWTKAHEKGLVGLSVFAQIAGALRREGLLVDDPVWDREWMRMHGKTVER